MPRAVLDMSDRRSIWSMPGWVSDEIRDALPDGWELVVISEETDGSGDGAARVSPMVLEAVQEAEIYFGFGVPEELLEAAPRLEWAHSGAAGVTRSLTPAMLESSVVLTNSAGVHGPPIAETVLGMILYFFRGLDFAVEGQRRREWSVDSFWNADAPIRELSASTVGILGFGGIGREVARRVASLGARVVTVRRSPVRQGQVDLEAVGGEGTVGSHIELRHGDSGLEAMLGESDALVLTTPLTEETRGIIDAQALSRMKASAVLINVARGKLVDEHALIEALREGRLRGAGLDVFDKEPLESDHPLWELPNVVLTPHVSAVTRGFWRRETDLILENVRCYFDRAPLEAWQNVVDKRAGY